MFRCLCVPGEKYLKETVCLIEISNTTNYIMDITRLGHDKYYEVSWLVPYHPSYKCTCLYEKIAIYYDFVV